MQDNIVPDAPASRFQKILKGFVGMGALFFATVIASSASAVQVSTDNRGDALIIPVFTTKNGLATLISVTDTDRRIDDSQAVKVNFRDRLGDSILSVNVYLTDGAAWIASLSAENQSLVIGFPGQECTLGGGAGAVSPLSKIEAGKNIGFVEVISMGYIEDGTLNGYADSGDCKKLGQEWNQGDWSRAPNSGMGEPPATLRVSTSIINVEDGTLYSIPAFVLSQFSDIPQHHLPSASMPNLGSVHDAGTSEGATASHVCTEDGCRTDTWANPADAVSAVLMVQELVSEFVVDPDVDGATELLITYPTRYLYPADSGIHESEIKLLTTNRNGGVHPPSAYCPEPGYFGCQYNFSFSQQRSVEVIDMSARYDDRDTIIPSRILGIPGEVVVYRDSVPEAGTVRIGFANRGLELVSNEGRHFHGKPVIGFILQEYVNGELRDSEGKKVRSNYGNALPYTRTRRITND